MRHRQQARHHERLALSLLTQLHIQPEGHELAALLQDFGASNNLVALSCWVGKQTAILASDERMQSFDLLERRLQSVLIDSGHGG